MAQKETLKAHEKQSAALALALSGADYQTIADKVGYNSRQAAWKAVKSALDKSIRHAADEVRVMQIARLDKMLVSIWASVERGNLSAIDRAIRLEERRAKLLGLDMPEKHEQSGKIEIVVTYEDRDNASKPSFSAEDDQTTGA